MPIHQMFETANKYGFRTRTMQHGSYRVQWLEVSEGRRGWWTGLVTDAANKIVRTMDPTPTRELYRATDAALRGLL